MARLRKSLTLKHQPNLGVDVEEVVLCEGEEVTLLREWSDHYLCKNAAGQLFNVPKQWIDPS